MDLRFTPEELAFRDEVRQFFRTEIPAEIRRKVSEGRGLTREDYRHLAAHPQRQGLVRAALAEGMGRAGLDADPALHLHRGDAARRRAAAAAVQLLHGRAGDRRLRHRRRRRKSISPASPISTNGGARASPSPAPAPISPR